MIKADWADDATEKRLNRVQGNKSKGKQRNKHWIDSLISVTATNKADAFVSEDNRVKPALKRTVDEGLKLQVWDYDEFRRQVVTMSEREKGVHGR
jgi:hypothetical protein